MILARLGGWNGGVGGTTPIISDDSVIISEADASQATKGSNVFFPGGGLSGAHLIPSSVKFNSDVDACQNIGTKNKGKKSKGPMVSRPNSEHDVVAGTCAAEGSVSGPGQKIMASKHCQYNMFNEVTHVHTVSVQMSRGPWEWSHHSQRQAHVLA